MYEIFWLSFLVLTIMHPIGDFLIGNRRRFRGEFWLVLNPLHWWWDSSRFRKHGQFIKLLKVSNPMEVMEPGYSVDKKGNIDLHEVSVVPFYHNFNIYQVQQKFWFWLGVDQLAHVFLNIIFALFLEVIL